MNRFWIGLIGLFMFCATVSGDQYGCDPTDRTFVAYRLCPVEEATFRITDYALSSFWYRMLDCPTVDYIYISLLNNGVADTGLTNEDDANITVYLAYGDSGLYIFYKVADNCWVNPALPGAWVNDAADFSLDPIAPNARTPQSFPVSNDYGTTKTSARYLLQFGTFAPANMWYCFLDPLWQSSGNPDSAINWNTAFISIETAQSQHGITGSIKPVVQGYENIRLQEWRIPWRSIGNPNAHGLGQCPNLDDQISAYFGYNDVDTTATATSAVKKLRTGSGDYTSYPGTTPIDPWSTILFGPNMDERTSNCLMHKGRRSFMIKADGCAISVRQPQLADQFPDSKIARIEYFNLSGQRLNMRNNKPTPSINAIIIERKTRVNGIVSYGKTIVK
jgi:hypothetical protein